MVSPSTKDQIKEAVSESLLEALEIAEAKQKRDRFSLRSIAADVVNVLQIILLPVLAYLLLQSVQVQKEIVSIQEKVGSIEHHLIEHDEDTIMATLKNARIHHVEPEQKCNSCHGGNIDERIKKLKEKKARLETEAHK